MSLPLQNNSFLACHVCRKRFTIIRKPVTMPCCHTICSQCLESLEVCPVDKKPIKTNMPCNRAILHLSNVMITADDDIPVHFESQEDEEFYYSSMTSMMDLASILKPSHPLSSMLSRSMQKKLQGLLNCQVLEPEGRSKLLRHARSVGERCLSEILVKQQDTRALSSNLWTAVRQKGCQFLGPVVQEEALNMVLTALKDGTELSRRVLVDYVVHKLSEDFPNQSTKTAIGHVIQLLYRASCFNVTKREESSSLMQLKEEYRSYESLRREHDAQIVSIAQDSGLRICPEQWSFLLYGDALHKSHMQSIIDRLQSPESFRQSLQELTVSLNRTGNHGHLSTLTRYFETLSAIDVTSVEGHNPSLKEVSDVLLCVTSVTIGLIDYLALMRRLAEQSKSPQTIQPPSPQPILLPNNIPQACLYTQTEMIDVAKALECCHLGNDTLHPSRVSPMPPLPVTHFPQSYQHQQPSSCDHSHQMGHRLPYLIPPSNSLQAMSSLSHGNHYQ